jgi:nucleoid-associated protein Lsr2
MAQKITVALEDDLDGGAADETVRFGIGGAVYEIDLSAKNAAELRQTLAPFIDHARARQDRDRAAVPGGPRRAGSAARASERGPRARASRSATSDASPRASSSGTKPPTEIGDVSLGQARKANSRSGHRS